MKIAVEGCCHGELDKIYETLQHLERVNKIKVDLLLICGDFQAVRNRDDLKAMAVPPKYQKLNTFYKYYSGEKEAPVLTVFIGGNHEASNYMQELPYGGWVAKNIYYMGYANVIEVGGLRIGGLSGIYKKHDYFKGHFEHAPYTEDTKRSVYHIRSLEVFRLKQLTCPVDIFMSHDWPKDIARYGNLQELFRKKSFLQTEILNGELGSPPAAELLRKLQPAFWFSAHLHVKYSAVVQHSPQKCTRFLSLDKCLPRRQFLQVLDFPDPPVPGPLSIKLDPEWLCVLKATNHLLHLGRALQYMPGPSSGERYSFEVSEKEMSEMMETFADDLTLPHNFKPTAPTLSERNFKSAGPPVLTNPQTTLLCTMVGLTDPNAVHLGVSSHYPIDENPTTQSSDHDSADDPISEDDTPSDINSSMDSSFISRSTDFSDPSRTPVRRGVTSRLPTGNSTSPAIHIEDDDEEFRAILAAQRQNSQQSDMSGRSVVIKNARNVDCEAKDSFHAAQSDSIDNDLASILAAQQRRGERFQSDLISNQKLSDDAASSVDKSSSDLESTSQDSQDESDQPQSQADSSQSSVMDCVEVSTGSDSPKTGCSTHSPGTKRPSPEPMSGPQSAVKKLKRRNVSVYSCSGTEEDAC